MCFVFILVLYLFLVFLERLRKRKNIKMKGVVRVCLPLTDRVGPSLNKMTGVYKVYLRICRLPWLPSVVGG